MYRSYKQEDEQVPYTDVPILKIHYHQWFDVCMILSGKHKHLELIKMFYAKCKSVQETCLILNCVITFQIIMYYLPLIRRF